MESCCGAFNTSGFSSQLQSISQGMDTYYDLKRILPSTDHLTYAGMFNEMEFEIGEKTQKPLDLHVSFARATNPSSMSDKRINQFLALFLKGSKNGEPRDHRILNAVIVLDISGSMAGGLTSNSLQSRLSLAKQAIKMFISKLKPTDSFGIVTFNNDAQIIVKGARKSEINLNNVFAMIDNINVYGGTTLSSGFQKGLQVLNSIIQKTKSKEDCENRIVMITDVGDNSFNTTNNFISQVSQKQIHTTIIGVSDDFESSICQKLTTIKGFNYFCAVNKDDLMKYLYENFDWTFFPSSYNIQIKLKSQNIQLFEVFGSPDSAMVNQYNDFSINNNEYIISKIPSSFPSQLIIENGIVKTTGGLILLKLSPQNNLTQFKGVIELTYTTYNGINMSQTYPIEYSFPKNEQFYSELSISEGINGFYFVNQMKHLIQSVKSDQRKDDELRNAYKESFEKLREFTPKSKIEDVDVLLKIFNKK